LDVPVLVQCIARLVWNCPWLLSSEVHQWKYIFTQNR